MFGTTLDHASLTRNYNNIVRINPDELHVDDIEIFGTLYALGVKRDKGPHHIQMFGTPLSCKTNPTRCSQSTAQRHQSFLLESFCTTP
jgi:hypothetical protein